MPTVSVVVPSFNTASYLGECLDSVLAQTFQDWEAVCIDDGSTDETPDVLAGYAAKDTRIQWLSQSNRGLSATRNRALEIASGTYVLFLDSDDKLAPDALKKLVRKAGDDRLDVLLFSGTTFSDDETLLRDHPGYASLYADSADLSVPRTGPELLRDLVQAKEYRSSACLQMNRRSHLDENRIRFFDGILHEDNLFTFRNLLSASRAARINDPLYLRRMRADSIMTARTRCRNTEGYAVCAREMFRAVWETPPPGNVRESCATAILAIIRAVRRTFGELDASEAEKLARTSPVDRLWISTLRNSRTEEDFQTLKLR